MVASKTGLDRRRRLIFVLLLPTGNKTLSRERAIKLITGRRLKEAKTSRNRMFSVIITALQPLGRRYPRGPF